MVKLKSWSVGLFLTLASWKKENTSKKEVQVQNIYNTIFLDDEFRKIHQHMCYLVHYKFVIVLNDQIKCLTFALTWLSQGSYCLQNRAIILQIYREEQVWGIIEGIVSFS